MTIDEHIKHWTDGAKDDLDSAFEIFNLGRYNWALFIGHLALEKLLKAIYILNSGNTIPPKIHNLLKLAELSNINLSIEQSRFFANLNRCQIEARYIEQKKELYKIATKEFTLDYLEKIKEQYQWLKQLIK